jgi:16S rRNA (guanine527-N7)-methyltransferase
LELAITTLGIDNATVVRGRAQDVTITADRVTARAVSATKNLLVWLAPLVSQHGRMVLMKGQKAQEELEASRGWLRRNGWQAQVRDVGSPPRARVVVVDRTVKG